MCLVEIQSEKRRVNSQALKQTIVSFPGAVASLNSVVLGFGIAEHVGHESAWI